MLSAGGVSASMFPGFGEGEEPEPLCRETDKNRFNREYFKKIQDFDRTYSDDIHASMYDFKLLCSVQKKLKALQGYVGYGNFNILNFDDALTLMDRAGRLDTFTRDEHDFIERTFYRNAAEYGFYGEKILTELTLRVDENRMVKVPGTGHYIYKGEAYDTYRKITGEMKTLTLTSGVRSVVKQMYLFFSKAVETKGNLSQASRSLAPPGYSYHGCSDFDVGIKGWGYANFTDKFATTREYSRLLESGYMRIRYDRKNPYGVRFEPWHVKVV
ncbi:M15 family metallopeptidase [Limisalsivibrio acetivorans]|uniref:M15 family metallopeptidase n=1 Tax=Limisalsivibrio acetivorans TaxID=1304888 RepID=UPI0003B5FB23|nr:M15 family metallopeptidase [Limisalsivibrio acetivorans]